jgi:uncharacterized protein (TIGR00730 family)
MPVKPAKTTTKGNPRIIPADESVFLEGPKNRGYELIFSIKVWLQFLKAFRTLHFVGPCITIFGSARFEEGHVFYQKAREFGKRIAEMGFTTMTGGGPGIMEAANRGAYENGGISVGCNIKLPAEQHPNKYLHTNITIDYFFLRKEMLMKYSYAFICMPGGFGTMDEFFETLTLIQTKSITQFPIILFGKEYYKELADLMADMVQQRAIDPEDLQLVLITDSVDEAMQHIHTYITGNYKVLPRKRFWWLLERS